MNVGKPSSKTYNMLNRCECTYLNYYFQKSIFKTKKYFFNKHVKKGSIYEESHYILQPERSFFLCQFFPEIS